MASEVNAVLGRKLALCISFFQCVLAHANKKTLIAHVSLGGKLHPGVEAMSEAKDISAFFKFCIFSAIQQNLN